MSDSAVCDVAVVGAGAAGIAAARRLRAAGVSTVVLEAKDRVGGRAHTLADGSGAALDLGCGWLHSADRNAWAMLAEPMGFTLDRSDPAWTKPALTVNFPAEAQAAYHKVFQAFEERLERAAESEADQIASNLIHEDERPWAPLLNAFSGYYNGAPFDQISVKDYAAYQPTDQNWRVREGYGALISACAAELDIRLSTPVSRLDYGGFGVRLTTGAGVLVARTAIVAVSSTILAEGRLAFDPPLPDKRDAAADLPLGHVEKVFLRLIEPADFPIETMVRGRTDTAETGGYTLRPMGMPMIEGFYGGDLAAALELEAKGAFASFAIDELTAVFGTGLCRRVEAIAESSWRTDPFVRGAYSHARVGRAGARAVLAAPVADRVFFAGEACSAHAFSTAHGAYETGLTAAIAALASLK
jgi:monoamine oxidase